MPPMTSPVATDGRHAALVRVRDVAARHVRLAEAVVGVPRLRVVASAARPPVGKARGVTEHHPWGDARGPFVVGQIVVGHVLDKRSVEVDPPGVGELHHRVGDDRLGQRGRAEDRVLVDCSIRGGRGRADPRTQAMRSSLTSATARSGTAACSSNPGSSRSSFARRRSRSVCPPRGTALCGLDPPSENRPLLQPERACPLPDPRAAPGSS